MNAIDMHRDGPVATITLNRPAVMNALGEDGDGDLMASLCEEINRDGSVRVAILTGAGKAFSAGGNVKAMQARTGMFVGDPAAVRQGYRRNIHRILRAIHGLDVPLIAAVNGAAIGLGCDLACLADMRIASSTARFGVTFLKIGLVPGDGGAWILPRLIGMSRASDLLYSGRLIGPDLAEQWGLVSEVAPPEALMARVLEHASRIAEQPGEALRATKMLLRQGQTTTYDTMLELSASTQGLMHFTGNHAEGIAAILEKRSPGFDHAAEPAGPSRQSDLKSISNRSNQTPRSS